MSAPRLVFWSVCAGALVLPGCRKEVKPVASLQQPTRTLRLPIQFYDPDAGEATLAANKLTYNNGADDEPPEGPTSFEALEDGTIAIADPMQRRVVFFNEDGGVVRQLRLSFPPGRLSKQTGGDLFVRNPLDGTWHAANQEARQVAEPRPALPTARLTGLNRAFVLPPGAPESQGIPIAWESSVTRLLSVEPLERESDGTFYVALEAAAGDLDGLQKVIRKCARDGRVLAEVRGVPIDYYATPLDEFRVRFGVLYQLEPLRDDVRINVWDLRSY
jgi:hypothetical protein